MERTYTVVLFREESGGFSVSVPALRGCHTQGETVPECLDMAREAIRGFVRSVQKHGETVRPLQHQESCSPGYTRSAMKTTVARAAAVVVVLPLSQVGCAKHRRAGEGAGG